MQVSAHDVMTGVVGAWNTSTLLDLVPGGLWFTRPPTETVMPYTVGRIVPGEIERWSGLNYLQKFNVQLSAFSNSVPTETGLIDGQMRTLLDDTPTFFVPNAVAVVRVVPRQGRYEMDELQKDSADVLIATGAWEILIQATRVNQ